MQVAGAIDESHLGKHRETAGGNTNIKKVSFKETSGTYWGTADIKGFIVAIIRDSSGQYNYLTRNVLNSCLVLLIGLLVSSRTHIWDPQP